MFVRLVVITWTVLVAVAAPAPAGASELGTVTFDVFFAAPPLQPTGGFPNSGGIAMTHTNACAGEVVGKATVAGPCSVNGAGGIDFPGWCDAYTGQLTGEITFRDVTGTRSVVVSYSMSVTLAGAIFTGAGTASSGSQTGPISLQAAYLPPGTPLNPSSGSCLTGTATTFRVIGEIELSTS